MRRGLFTKLSAEDRFARKYECWAQNHVRPWSKHKTENRRLARARLKETTKIQIKECINEGE